MHAARDSVSISTCSPATRLSTWKRPAVSSSTASVEVEPVNGKEELGEPPEHELLASRRLLGRQQAPG